MKENLYDILGVEKDATQEAIEKRMQALQAAYAVLSDAEKRKVYDASRPIIEFNRPQRLEPFNKRLDVLTALEKMVTNNAVTYVHGTA
jgi:curved DNA-binding protein CbpA